MLLGVHIWRTTDAALWGNLVAAEYGVLRYALRPQGGSSMKAGEIVCAKCDGKFGIIGPVLRITLGICLTVFLTSSALAQYGGGGTGMGTGTPGTPGMWHRKADMARARQSGLESAPRQVLGCC